MSDHFVAVTIAALALAMPGCTLSEEPRSGPSLRLLMECPPDYLLLSPECKNEARDLHEVQRRPPPHYFCVQRGTEPGNLRLMRTAGDSVGLVFDFTSPRVEIDELIIALSNQGANTLLRLRDPGAGFVEIGRNFSRMDTIGVVGSRIHWETDIVPLRGGNFSVLWAPTDTYVRPVYRIQTPDGDPIYLDGYPPGKDAPGDIVWSGEEGTIAVSYELPVSQLFGASRTVTPSCASP